MLVHRASPLTFTSLAVAKVSATSGSVAGCRPSRVAVRPPWVAPWRDPRSRTAMRWMCLPCRWSCEHRRCRRSVAAPSRVSAHWRLAGRGSPGPGRDAWLAPDRLRPTRPSTPRFDLASACFGALSLASACTARLSRAGIQGFEHRSVRVALAQHSAAFKARTSLGLFSLQGLTQATLGRISPTLPSRSWPYRSGRCRSLRVSIGHLRNSHLFGVAASRRLSRPHGLSTLVHRPIASVVGPSGSWVRLGARSASPPRRPLLCDGPFHLRALAR